MASTKSSVVYALPHGGAEVERLNALQDVISKCNGFTLHPRLHPVLNKDAARVADIATGTGAFMRGLEREAERGKHEFIGFDISDASFPTEASENFTFHVHDAREPCPSVFEERFDLVHIRLIIAGMGRDDWPKAAECAQAMLKPGGALMWTELRMQDAVPALRSGVQASRRGLDDICQCLLDILGERLNAGVLTLQPVFTEIGMQGVEMDVASSDRLPELREMATMALVDGAEATIRHQAGLNALESWTPEKIADTRRGAEEDVQAGMYTRFNIHNFTAFKA
ncbi:MAG: hypothetical protein Q9162_007618 [Coniocarpon cinnabarinum]